MAFFEAPHSGSKTTKIYTHVLRTAVRLAYVGRPMGHEDFHGGSYADPHTALWQEAPTVVTP